MGWKTGLFPGGTAIPGQPGAKAEQAPDTSPCSKNQSNIEVPNDHMQLKQQQSMEWDEPLVTQQQMEEFYPHLEKMLTDIEFLDPNNPRLLPLRLRRLFGRIQLDRMEYHLLRGIFSRVQALANGSWKKSNKEDHSHD